MKTARDSQLQIVIRVMGSKANGMAKALRPISYQRHLRDQSVTNLIRECMTNYQLDDCYCHSVYRGCIADIKEQDFLHTVT